MTGECEEPTTTVTDSCENPVELNQHLQNENRRLKKQIRQLKATAKAKKKIEFSKLILMGVSALTLAITVFSCRIIWITMDTSALAYLIPAVFTEMASATGFYYSKAKAENKIKLMSLNGVQPEASDFNIN